VLLVRHEHVAMIGNTIEHARDARPANALLTRHRDLDAIRQQDIKHGSICRNGEAGPGAGDLHLEGIVGARGVGCRREELFVQLFGPPARTIRPAENRFDETIGSANIEVVPRARLLQRLA